MVNAVGKELKQKPKILNEILSRPDRFSSDFFWTTTDEETNAKSSIRKHRDDKDQKYWDSLKWSR